MIYSCICGKCFEKPNSLNAHKATCKLYYESTGKDYNKYLNKLKTGRKEYYDKLKEENKNKKSIKLEKWLSENHKCEYCNKTLTSYFGSGRFCNLSCASKYNPNNNRGWKNNGRASTIEKENERKLKISKTCKKNAGGYRPGAGRGKQGRYKGYWCDSSWELAYVIYNLEHNIEFSRNKDKFEYLYENSIHKYIPDFIEDNYYIEIKGFERPNDKYKYKSVKNLKILYEKDIEKYLHYVIDKYGKNFIKLYE